MSKKNEIEARQSIRRAHDRLQRQIAFLVALVATTLAMINIKDGNVVQAMAVTHTRAVDAWAHYQAKSLKQSLAEATREQLQIQTDLLPPERAETRSRLTGRTAELTAKIERYQQEETEIKVGAETLEKEYARLSTLDNQLDIAQACISTSLAMFAITALTSRRWLLALSMTIAGYGMLLGIGAFAGWSMRPEWLAKLLG